MKDFLNQISKLLAYNDINYLLTDIVFYTNTISLIALVAFFFSYRQPFLLILLLEIIYLCININFAVCWILTGYDLSLTYVLIILGITTAETVIGLVLIVFLAKLHWMSISNISKLK